MRNSKHISLITTDTDREAQSARQEIPIFPRLGQKVRDQQIFKGMSDAVPDDLANLVTSIDCIPAAIDDDDVGTKIEDAITPLRECSPA